MMEELAKLQQQIAAAEKDRMETKTQHEKELAQERRQSQDSRRQLQRLLASEEVEHNTTKRSLQRAEEQVITAIAIRTTETARADTAEEKFQNAERAQADRERVLQGEISSNKDPIRLGKLQLTEAKDAMAAKNIALDALQKQAVILNEQMAKIRDEMKKAGHDREQKRKAGDDAGGGQSKTTRT